MSAEEKDYYVVESDKDGHGLVSMNGYFNVEKFEWEACEYNPLACEIKKSYKLALTGLNGSLRDLDFDFYRVSLTYVSERFLKVCDALGIKYRAVPMALSQGKECREDDFYIFLPAEHIAVMDRERSDYTIARDLETGAISENRIFPGLENVDSINNLIMVEQVESHLFICQETLELFCSGAFFRKASGLKGIRFKKIDRDYRYDPWSELDDL